MESGELRAAVRIADTDGLDAVSMGRVAAELGAAAMSLYRHVSAKEELLTLMVDAAWGDSPDPRSLRQGCNNRGQDRSISSNIS